MNHWLVIRADAGLHEGAGHLMRCLALAQQWQSCGGQVHFVSACNVDGLRSRIFQEGFTFTAIENPFPHPADWEIFETVLRSHERAWVVVDGYHFDSTYQRLIKESGCRLMVIDDMAPLPHYYADIILNQNMHAQELHYKCEPFTELLLGIRYALLRPEFLVWQNWQRQISVDGCRVLVTLGGSDPEDQTVKVIEAIEEVAVSGLETAVVIGPANGELKPPKSPYRGSGLSTQYVCDADNMAELMAWADVAISAAGSTCWELMFMGVPSLMLVKAENQQPIAEKIAEAHAGINLGWYYGVTKKKIADNVSALLLDHGLRESMSHRGRDCVDGLGVRRVLSSLGDSIQDWPHGVEK